MNAGFVVMCAPAWFCGAIVDGHFKKRTAKPRRRIALSIDMGVLLAV